MMATTLINRRYHNSCTNERENTSW